jgi:UDP-glucose 4-epimerase
VSRQKIVVVGGSGFLGSHLADELSDRGFDIIVYDSYPSLYIRDDQTMVIGDIFDREKLSSVFAGTYAVFHFAAMAEISATKADPYKAVNVNVMGTLAVLEAAIDCGVDRFVYASTMYVYSAAGSFYRASKQSAEILIEAYQQTKNINYTFLRYGSLYGPRAQGWNGIMGYVKEIVDSGKLKYKGTGEELREYIHVKDAAKLSADILDKQYENQAVTITGVQSLTSSQLIRLIFEVIGAPLDLELHPELRDKDHYSITPYRYSPKAAIKLVSNQYVDLGQGILELVESIHTGKR